MKKLHLLLGFALLLATATSVSAEADTQEGGQAVPLRAIPLNDGNITEYGARLRVTKSAWNFALLTIRDNFRRWSAPTGAGVGAGANLLIDPGYDCINQGSAGLVRTTPYVYDYVRWDGTIQRNDYNLNCGDYIWPCNGCNADRTCGRSCSKTAIQAPSDVGSTMWTQVRRPQANLGTNQPTVPSVARPKFREFGFYIADPAAGQDFKQMQFCTNRYAFDSGSGKSGTCPDARKNFEVCAPPFDWPCTTIYFHYNVRLFIFPNMRTEYMGISGNCTFNPSSCKYPHDPAQGFDPWNPPTNRGSYTGLSTTNNVGTIGGAITDCRTGSAGWCNTGGNCCCTWCACLAKTKSSGCYWNYTAPVYRYVFQAAVLPHSPTNTRNGRDGTYIRGGDDQALYTNIGQMQIHSYNRNSFLGTESVVNRRGCEREWYYDGTIYDKDTGPGVNMQPRLIRHNTKAANCMYPKSYWDFTLQEWRACDPFDTWNADGTVNPNNDDAKFMYPGHPDTGGYGSPGRCGRQTFCTSSGGGNCSVYTPTNTFCTGTQSGSGCTWGVKAKTTRFKDLLEPGGGWYFIKIQTLEMCPANTYCATAVPNTSTQPRMVLDLRIPDVRAELGLALDARVEGAVVTDQDMRNIRAAGQIKMNSIAVKASVVLTSLDDKSCTSGASCQTPFGAVNDGVFSPDQIQFDVSIDEFKISSPNPWYVGECDQFFFDIIWGAGFTISACDFINDDIHISLLGFPISFSLGVKPMLEGIIEDALSDEIKSALGDFIAAVPNLNSVLGDPINVMGRSLIETGIYAAGGLGEAITVGGTTRYPVHMWPGPTAEQVVTDFRFALGFKPIAFHPPVGPNQVMLIDNIDPPAATSVYGVPTLMNPRTAGCPGCSTRPAGAPGTAAYVDEDQQYDTDDHVLAAGGWWHPNPTGSGSTFLARYRAVPEYWQGPIPEENRPPSWCAKVPDENNWEMPRTIRSGGGRALDFKSLYPQTTWLSFDRGLDKPHASSGMSLPPWNPKNRNTYGGWDSMDANTVFRQNRNDGSLETAAVPYDFSLHVHQRTIAQFLQTMVASGATCIEFAPKNEAGNDTVFKSFLNTNMFAAVLPDLYREFPDQEMKVRLHAVGTPRARTGLGRLEYVPAVFPGTPAGEAALPIAPTAYMLSAAFPDTRIEFIVTKEGVDIPLLTMYWTPVVGLHMQSVRRCFYLDPLFNDPAAGGDLNKSKCFSPFTNVRTISGYYEIYIDMGSDSLKDAWSAGGTYANTRDFPAGYFSDIGTSRFFKTAPTSTKSHIVIASSYCDFSSTCDRLAVSQLVPTLMDSFISLFMVSRFSILNLSLDFLYTGVDGPNDDGIGQGDYIGVYARFLGSLDLFSLLENLGGMFAPKSDIEPSAFVPDRPEATQWFTTNRPAFPVKMVKQFEQSETPSDIAYTYSLNGGFWHTPITRDELVLGPLWEGEHKLALRAVEHTQFGATAGLTPFEVRFRVDTVPPDVNIRPSPRGVYNKAVVVSISDLQTPANQVKSSYRWNDDEWQTLEGAALSVRSRTPGKHTLRVRATDLAGNTGEAARVITVGEPGFWGCGQAGARPDAGWALVLLVVLWGRKRLAWQAKRA